MEIVTKRKIIYNTDYSNACGCSGADGSSNTPDNIINDKYLIISASMIGLFTIGIISIFALTIKKY